MYQGFNLTLDDDSVEGRWLKRQYVNYSSKHEARKASTCDSISGYLKGGAIDAKKLQEDWFQSVKADVFISHSHADETLAVAIAAALEDKLELKCFVDSCVWGNSEVLLKEIDNKYCVHSNGTSYDYDQRNRSTSHVHMMLQGALAKMIARTECVIFLNTPKSMVTKDELENETRTGSPWIYTEVLTTKLIEKQSLERPYKLLGKRTLESAGVVMDGLPPFYHDLDLEHLTPMNTSDFTRWLSTVQRGTRALDELYGRL
ncbi:hypothetical protein [Ralstonia solanacearum]|uniref:hypothetical protein n=1 Tax=Ralstonia solanacearum TaxID=305 RepID=UPI003CC6896F